MVISQGPTAAQPSAKVGQDSDTIVAITLNIGDFYIFDSGLGTPNNFASSAEFVGGLWFGESSKRVKQGHFHGFIGSKAEGSSGNDSYLVVETLDSAA